MHVLRVHAVVQVVASNSTQTFATVRDIIRARGHIIMEGMLRMLRGLPEVFNPSFKASAGMSAAAVNVTSCRSQVLCSRTLQQGFIMVPTLAAFRQLFEKFPHTLTLADQATISRVFLLQHGR
jgi:hypothetical protein